MTLLFPKWEGIFTDTVTTAATIDCLVYYSIIVELSIRSYRLGQAWNNI
jgi:hypothetical protein